MCLAFILRSLLVQSSYCCVVFVVWAVFPRKHLAVEQCGDEIFSSSFWLFKFNHSFQFLISCNCLLTWNIVGANHLVRKTSGNCEKWPLWCFPVSCFVWSAVRNPQKYWDSFFFFLKDVLKCLRDLRRDRLATTGWYGNCSPTGCRVVSRWIWNPKICTVGSYICGSGNLCQASVAQAQTQAENHNQSQGKNVPWLILMLVLQQKPPCDIFGHPWSESGDCSPSN